MFFLVSKRTIVSIPVMIVLNTFLIYFTTLKTQHINYLLFYFFRMINHVMKQGSGTANTLGVLAVMYSAFGVLLQFARGEDDDINTVLAGTATGFLYKSTGNKISFKKSL